MQVCCRLSVRDLRNDPTHPSSDPIILRGCNVGTRRTDLRGLWKDRLGGETAVSNGWPQLRGPEQGVLMRIPGRDLSKAVHARHGSTWSGRPWARLLPPWLGTRPHKRANSMPQNTATRCSRIGGKSTPIPGDCWSPAEAIHPDGLCEHPSAGWLPIRPGCFLAVKSNAVMRSTAGRSPIQSCCLSLQREPYSACQEARSQSACSQDQSG